MKQERLELQAQQFTQGGEFSPTLKECYMEGYKQAYISMIEKAEEWLWNNFYEHPHERWLIFSESFDTIEYMIERFKAAMEE